MIRKHMNMMLILSVVMAVGIFCGISYKSFAKNKNTKTYFNIVLVGAAGSGKGTQGDLLKQQSNLYQISAGNVLRSHRAQPNGKYTKVINQYIDKGQLVPSKITHALMEEDLEKNVFCEDCKYDGIIFDGYPREMAQVKLLNKFLKKKKNKINAVVYIDVPMEALVDRLHGRFACAKCGELYHKTTKPTKVEGVCDKCGGHRFLVRDDDKNPDAIRQRFKIFENSTSIVLKEYNKAGIVIKVDGAKKPADVYAEILEKLKPFQLKK